MERQRQRHDPTKSLVGFVVGDVQYAAPISRVREITNPLPLVALPHASPAVRGVAEYRGQVCPVVDLRARFGLAPSAPTRRTKWILVEFADRLIALIVDAVTEVFGTGGAELRPAPPLGGGEDKRGIAGVTTYGGTMVFVLDLARLRDLTEPLVAAGAITGASIPAGALPKAVP